MRIHLSQVAICTLSAAALVAVGIASWQPQAGATTPSPVVSYSGDAQVVDVDLLLLRETPVALPITVDVVRAGPLPATGGFMEENLLTVGDPPDPRLLIDAKLAHALTTGNGFEAYSEAHVAHLDLGLGPEAPDALRITATVLHSEAKAVCAVGGGVELTGSSHIVDLTINGEGRPITGEPNQVIEIPNVAQIIINEQGPAKTDTSGEITVTALHIRITPPDGNTGEDSPLAALINGEIYVARSHADISGCPAVPPPCEATNTCPPCEETGTCPPCTLEDLTTGEGFVRDTDGDEVCFSLSGGRAADGTLLGGHLHVLEHSADGSEILSDQLFDYQGSQPSLTRVLKYHCNYGNGVCVVTVTDDDTPRPTSGNSDRFLVTAEGAKSYGSTTVPIESGSIEVQFPRGCRVENGSTGGTTGGGTSGGTTGGTTGGGTSSGGDTTSGGTTGGDTTTGGGTSGGTTSSGDSGGGDTSPTTSRDTAGGSSDTTSGATPSGGGSGGGAMTLPSFLRFWE